MCVSIVSVKQRVCMCVSICMCGNEYVCMYYVCEAVSMYMYEYVCL